MALLLTIVAKESTLIAVQHSGISTVAGCLLVGIFMAPRSAFCFLAVENLAPPDTGPEEFALLRTANSFGLLPATAALAWAPPEYGLALGAALPLAGLMLPPQPP